MLNKCAFIGHLGADPEIRTLNSGTRLANFRIAVTEKWKDKNTGERKEQTEWITVVCFNDNLVKVIEQYLAKGSKVYVEGQFKTRKWEKDGVDRYTTEVVMQNFGGTLILLDRKEGGGASADDKYSGYDRGGGSGGGEFKQDARGNTREDFSDDLDDPIPFVTRWTLR